MTRILVISGDILPYPGLPTTGAGLRAWGLAKGLEARGHDVRLAMPRSSLPNDQTIPSEMRDLLYVNQELPGFIRRQQPEVVVLQHWLLANFLDAALEVPLVIDFHGPLLLETQFQDNPVLEKLKRAKIQALHKADFFTCAGEKQKYYFEPWLMLAGFDLRQDVIAPIPVSLAPELPQHQCPQEPVFVYGGVFLPWQDPVLGLTTLIKCLETQNAGVLKFFGGKHPVVVVPTGGFEALKKQLEQSPRVQMQPMTPRDELIQAYCHASVAIDVMQRNAERELAFTTRTVEYLWCGLPVIYQHYAELSGYIRSYEAGWIVDPADPAAIRNAIEEILTNPELVAARSRNAQRLVREHLTWDKTIAPLDAFCRAPGKRMKGKPLFEAEPQAFLKQVKYLGEKFRFHLKNEGMQATLKRAWGKLRK